MKKNITQDQCKDTALAILLILLLLTWFSKKLIYVIPAIIVLIVSMVIPKIFKPFARLWFGLSHIMGEFVSKILMTIVFYLIVTPVALLRKIMGKDSMGMAKWKTGQQSVFTKRNHTFSAADLEKPF